MKIFLVSSGKIKEPFRRITEDYIKRADALSPAKIELMELKENADLEKKFLDFAQKGYLVFLDENGKSFNSIEFANFLEKSLINSKDLYFITGPASGFSESAKKQADMLLTLSSFTLQHDFATALFSEVLYRSFSILANNPYHKA